MPCGELYRFEKYEQAIEDVMTALNIDRDEKAFYELQQLADSAFEQTVARLKVRKVKEPNEQSWAYYLGIAYENAANFNKAIAYYKESLEQESNVITAYRISVCYNGLGDYDKALEYCNQAIALDSTDTDYIFFKADILTMQGVQKRL